MATPYFSTLLRALATGLLFLFAAQVTYGQKAIVTGSVSDASTGLPMEGVSVQLGKANKATITDKTGQFSFPADSVLTGQKITFSHLGYETFTFIIKQSQTKFTVALLPKVTAISEVKVTASKQLKTTKVLPETVLDFAIAGEQLYILSLGSKQKTPTLKILNLQSDQLLLTCKLPVYSRKLYVDCLNNLHLVNDDLVYQVYSDSLGLNLYPPATKASFEQFLAPCVAVEDQHIYLRRDINKGIIVSFYAVNQTTHRTRLLRTVLDKEMLIMQKNEARFMSNWMERESDSEAKYQNANRMKNRAARKAAFGQMFMMRGQYVPLLKVGNQICLFDHVNGKVEFYRSDSLTNVMPINYHRENNWARQNLVDPIKEKAYVVFARNGLPELKLLNLETGELEKSYKISNPFASKITVHDDNVYFLYKDMADNNRQHLYKAALSTLQN